jgi:hypothetical protein
VYRSGNAKPPRRTRYACASRNKTVIKNAKITAN